MYKMLSIFSYKEQKYHLSWVTSSKNPISKQLKTELKNHGLELILHYKFCLYSTVNVFEKVLKEIMFKF